MSNSEILKKIEEYLFEERKIITYKWLSQTHHLHINTAKKLLMEYSQNPTKSCNVFSTYLLSGILASGSQMIVISNKKDLDEAKKYFSVINSEHIYSIQTNDLNDVQLLYAVDKFSANDRNTCKVINFKDAIQLNKSVPTVKQSLVKKTEETKKQAEPKSIKPKGNSISSMFNSIKKEEKKTESDKKQKNEENKNTNTTKQDNPISCMLKNAKNTKSQDKKVETEERNLDNREKKKNQNEKGSSSKDESPKNKSVKKREELRKKPDSKKETEKAGTKRKRIRIFSDSESDSEDNYDRPPEHLPSEPVLKVQLRNDEEPKLPNVRKKRKIIDKYVMNEDGYMETQKTVVMASDSENEDEKQEKRENEEDEEKREQPLEKKDKPAAVSPKKGKPKVNNKDGKKQASLLSFFKKN